MGCSARTYTDAHVLSRLDDPLRRGAGRLARDARLAARAPGAPRRPAPRRGAGRVPGVDRRSPRIRSAADYTLAKARLGALADGRRRRRAARLDAVRRPRRAQRARCATRSRRAPARSPTRSRWSPPSSLIGGAARAAVRAVPDLPPRAALRLQPHDLAPLAGRRRQGLALGARRSACRSLAAVLWIMGAAGTAWWLWAWAAWMAIILAAQVVVPDRHRAALQPLRAAGRRDRCKARVQALMARAGFAAQGPVRDGRQPALGPRQRLLHRLRRAKRVVFFDTLLSRLAAGEVEAVLAHELGHFKLRHIRKRMVAMVASPSPFFALLGWLVDAGLVLHRPRRRAEPGAAERRARAPAVPARRVGVRRLRVAAVRRLVAPRRVRGRRLRLRAGRRPRPRLGPAEAARGQRLDPDARSAVRALLLFAPAGRRAPRRARRPALASRSHHDRLPRSSSARRAPAP